MTQEPKDLVARGDSAIENNTRNDRRQGAALNLTQSSVKSLISQGGDEHLQNAARANMKQSEDTGSKRSGADNNMDKNNNTGPSGGARGGGRSSSRLHGTNK